METSFIEIKRLQTPGLFLSHAFLILIVLIASFSDGAFNRPELLLLGVVGLIVIVFTWFIRLFVLHIHADTSGIKIKYPPYQKKFRIIKWNEIETASIVKYPFLGWGFQKNTKYGIFYTTEGSAGLYLRLLDGGNIFLGIKDLKRLKEVLKTIIPEKCRNIDTVERLS